MLDTATDVISKCLVQPEKLDNMTITPSSPCPSGVDGDMKYIRVYHDESTFYANADQTRFWNDGQSQVPCRGKPAYMTVYLAQI